MRPLPLPPDELLDDVVDALSRFDEAVARELGSLSPEQLLWRPAPESWSIAHCLAHLARTGAEYRDRISGPLQAARDAGRSARGPVKGGLLGRWFTGVVGPGGGMKVRAPAVFRPAEEDVSGNAVRVFRAEQARLRELAEGARGLDLDGVRVRSPVTAMVRFRLTDALRIVVAHEERHLNQARRVRGAAGFPAA